MFGGNGRLCCLVLMLCLFMFRLVMVVVLVFILIIVLLFGVVYCVMWLRLRLCWMLLVVS